ncbi:hypothetical protein [Candidatus Spongiihabitans sp.]|uniref:hypothetical protein n=1 Tax=Candidatus Spongiihabitans sp. TaxID=3101308 RepID=UPI003C6F0D76
MGQAQDLEGVVQGSGSDPQPQHGRVHPGPAGALKAGQAQTPPPVPAPCQALAIRDARWQPGELVQINHMSAGLPAGFGVKEFKAACPSTGFVALKAYSRATSRCARDFLAPLIEQAPFKILSIQVDGGSEFRDEFEQACEALNLPLFVLPPKQPEWDGCVERANAVVMSSIRCMKGR